MKLHLVLLSLILLVTGCTVGYQGNSENAKTTSSFEMRKECALLADKAKLQMEEAYTLAQPYFYDIFYSPKVDSCVYTHGLLLLGSSPNETGSFVLADFFSGETLVSETYYNGSGDEQLYSYVVREVWKDQVNEYR